MVGVYGRASHSLGIPRRARRCPILRALVHECAADLLLSVRGATARRRRRTDSAKLSRRTMERMRTVGRQCTGRVEANFGRCGRPPPNTLSLSRPLSPSLCIIRPRPALSPPKLFAHPSCTFGHTTSGRPSSLGIRSFARLPPTQTLDSRRPRTCGCRLLPPTGLPAPWLERVRSLLRAASKPDERRPWRASNSPSGSSPPMRPAAVVGDICTKGERFPPGVPNGRPIRDTESGASTAASASWLSRLAPE